MEYDVDFKKGKEYYIDYREGRDNQHKVTLMHFWSATMIFCRVRNKDTGYEWGDNAR